MNNGTDIDQAAWIKAYERRRVLRAAAGGLLCLLAGLCLGLLLGGCGTVTAPLPVDRRSGEEQAVHIVWVEVYGRTDRPPLVRWVQGTALSCIDPDSGKPGFPQFNEKAEAVCHEGFTWSPVEVLVSWHGEPSFSETALAHELLHALLLREFVVFELHHDRPDFFPRIDVANAALVQAGR